MEDNTFLFTLSEMQSGQFLAELDQKLRELNVAVLANERGGALTLKISVKPPHKRTGQAVVVECKATLALPEADHPSRILFVQDDARLGVHNPDQMQMFRQEKQP
jgi:hypothetical protein